MKHVILTILCALVGLVAAAQSTNPLNYSGRMYVEAIEIIATPRYVSYEDHAILSQQMRIPSVEITKIDMDFEKGIVIAKEIEMKIKVNGCKKYDTDRGWVVVVYVDLVNEGDKAELVWPEFGKPYFQQITKTEDGVKIPRMVLSRKPYVADESEALMNLLQGLGNHRNMEIIRVEVSLYAKTSLSGWFFYELHTILIGSIISKSPQCLNPFRLCSDNKKY